MPRGKKKNGSGKNTAILILDGSGSMAGYQDDVVGATNDFLKDRQSDHPETAIYLTVFDTNVKKVHSGTSVKDVPKVDSSVTLMGGMTALLDAVGSTLSKLENTELPGKKVVLIYTDGQENASREWTNEKVKALIEKLEAKGDWTITFASAGIDNFAQAQAMGVAIGNYAPVLAAASSGSNLRGISHAVSEHYTSNLSSTPDFVSAYNVKGKIDEEEEKDKSKKWAKTPTGIVHPK